MSCRSCSRATETSSPSGRGPAARGCSKSSERSRPTTCATSTQHDKVLAEQRQGVPRAATVAEIERELLELYRDPELDREARAARTAGRRVLQRGGGRARLARSRPATATVHEVDVRNEGTLAGLADDDVVEVPARVAPRHDRASSPGAARARAARPRPARRGLRAPRGARQRSPAIAGSRAKPCSRTR